MKLIICAIVFSLPVDQSKLFGYIVEICSTMLCGEAFYDVNGSVLVLFISMCFHHQAFANIFKYSTDKLNECNQKQKAEQIICDLVRFRILVQE